MTRSPWMSLYSAPMPAETPMQASGGSSYFARNSMKNLVSDSGPLITLFARPDPHHPAAEEYVCNLSGLPTVFSDLTSSLQ